MNQNVHQNSYSNRSQQSAVCVAVPMYCAANTSITLRKHGPLPGVF
jgi:hypothetical protein